MNLFLCLLVADLHERAAAVEKFHVCRQRFLVSRARKRERERKISDSYRCRYKHATALFSLHGYHHRRRYILYSLFSACHISLKISHHTHLSSKKRNNPLMCLFIFNIIFKKYFRDDDYEVCVCALYASVPPFKCLICVHMHGV